jgi:hypothetical protein
VSGRVLLMLAFGSSWALLFVEMQSRCHCRLLSDNGASADGAAGLAWIQLQQGCPVCVELPASHHHQINKLSHSINAIGPAPHRGGRKRELPASEDIVMGSAWELRCWVQAEQPGWYMLLLCVHVVCDMATLGTIVLMSN